MLKVDQGQCGMCAHFGDEASSQQLVQVRVNGEAPEDLIEPCGHPSHSSLALKVAPTSSCSGFTPHRQSA